MVPFTRLFKANLLLNYLNSIKTEKGAEGNPDCRAKQWDTCWDTLGKLNAIAGQVARGQLPLQAVHSDDYSQKHSQNRVKMMNSQDNYEWIAVTEVWDGLPRGTYFPKDHFFVLLFFSFLFSFIDKENAFLILLIASPSGSTQRHLFLRSPMRWWDG